MLSFGQFLEAAKQMSEDEYEHLTITKPFLREHQKRADQLWNALQKHISEHGKEGIGLRLDQTPIGSTAITHQSSQWERTGERRSNVGFTPTENKYSGPHYIPLSQHHINDRDQFNRFLALHHKHYGRVVENGQLVPNNIHLIVAKRDPEASERNDQNRTEEEREKYPEAVAKGPAKIIKSV